MVRFSARSDCTPKVVIPEIRIHGELSGICMNVMEIPVHARSDYPKAFRNDGKNSF
jgi:hypothetical protein